MKTNQVSDAIKKNFLIESEQTGRQIVKSIRTGRVYFVEAIGNAHNDFGDLDPVTKKMTGNYGAKYKGCISKNESLITKENGFNEIVEIQGGSPYSIIENLDSKYPNKG
jgi:hypothetical protein